MDTEAEAGEIETDAVESEDAQPGLESDAQPVLPANVDQSGVFHRTVVDATGTLDGIDSASRADVWHPVPTGSSYRCQRWFGSRHRITRLGNPASVGSKRRAQALQKGLNMPPPHINDHTNIHIGGQTLGQELNQRLVAFENGSAAVAHLFGHAGGVTIEIRSPGPPTGGDATANLVTMASHVIYQHGNAGALKPDGLDELAESTLFEIQNAVNRAAFTANDTALSTYNIALIPYGEQHARIEAQSSWLVGEALRQRHGYHPSAWGVAQEAASHGRTLVNFQNHFIAQPHSNKPADANTSKGLPSGEMYAFEALGSEKGVIRRGKVIAFLENAFNGLANNRNAAKNKKQLLNSMDNAIVKGVTQNAAADSVYCWFVDWIVNDAHFTTKTFNHGNHQADWEFTAAMKNVLNHGPYKKAEFDKLLSKVTFT